MYVIKTNLSKIFFTTLLLLALGCAISCTPSFADEEIINNPDDNIIIDAESDHVVRDIAESLSENVYSTSDIRSVDYAQEIYDYLYGVMQPTLLQIRNNTGGTTATTLWQLVKTARDYLNYICTSVQTPYIYGGSSPSILGYSILIKDALVSATGGHTVIDSLGILESNTSSSVGYLSSNASSSASLLNSFNSFKTDLFNYNWTSLSDYTPNVYSYDYNNIFAQDMSNLLQISSDVQL